MRRSVLLFTLAATVAASVWGADIKVIIAANGAKPAGPYSPGLLVGDYLYVAGQGSARSDGTRPEGFEPQVHQCLANVKAIVEGAGLTMNDVVYAHLYLADIKNYETVNKIWPQYFKVLPARATVGMARLPTDIPIEITVVAYKGSRTPVTLAGSTSPVPISPGILTADRFYIAGILGRDADKGTIPATPQGQVDMVLSRLDRVLSSAQINKNHLAFVNVYHTPQMPVELVTRALSKYWKAERPAIALVEVAALPFGTNVSITGIAARNLKDRSKDGDCLSIGATDFCSLSHAPGADVAAQTTGTLSKLKLDNVVATNLYLDSVDEFAQMNAAYGAVFQGKTLPSRTTVQPLKPGAQPHKFRFSFIRVR